MKIRNKKLLTKSIVIAIFMNSTLYTMPITHAAIDNNALPKLPDGAKPPIGVTIGTTNNNVMNISQAGKNAVIKWNDFSVGANATVNFNGPSAGFNTLNYVNGGNLSQIYGTINATNGNIYIVNPAGVQIGDSAQINVGSLYVSNNLNNDKLKNTFGKNTISNLPKSTVSGGELMSLGNINATNVTFDGNRIVLDVDRTNAAININTTNENNVVLGTDTGTISSNIKINDSNDIAGATYTWVKNLEQLQDIKKNVEGNYALRNNIDASATKDKAFTSIGNFTGKFDGLDYNIFGLHADKGLFASADGATIRNFSMISGEIGSSSKPTNNVGAVVGTANNSTIENILNTSKVTGTSNVGGIVGSATDSTLSGLINTGAIEGTSNVGGLVGNLVGNNDEKSFLTGESYNLGDIKGTANNVGGLVGLASNSTIGNEKGFQIYNHLDVEGGYNVGGIVGNLENGSTVQNVYNDGNVNAISYTNGDYKYHTNNSSIVSEASATEPKIATENVNIANVGGIVGNSNSSEINNVLNSGDISSNKQNAEAYYDAGNVGGIVGSAVDTNITDATNKESNIRGAHNVGGIAGYFGNSDNANTNKYTIKNAVNNGGDILATGARYGNNFVTELIRSDGDSEKFNIGNMGGIVGYMYGDNVYINTSANRGTVHSLEITGSTVTDPSKAANVGGIVGKIDRTKTNKDSGEFAINTSYNTGNVQGYTGVGGIAGMMYNGEIGNSYNLGSIQTTRISSIDQSSIEPVNMGGIVGDTTEASTARAYLYNVYNKGQIGDETYTYFGRHVGGVAGRLSGDIEKAYNNGAIYNGYSTVGGIVGWWFTGNIKNVFNTGNITVVNKNQGYGQNKMGSEVGGIAGATNLGTPKNPDNEKYNLCINLENAYNLGTIRSFWTGETPLSENVVGGIIGSINAYKYGDQTGGIVNIKNVYTLGNIWVGNADNNTNTTNTATNVGSIYGRNRSSGDIEVKISGSNYIKPKDTAQFTVLTGEKNNADKTINYEDRLDANNYEFDGASWAIVENKEVGESADWRIYKGNTTPILNIFLPVANGKFDDSDVVKSGIDNITSVQYGTAYDPLLTIIKATDNITLDWEKLGIYGDAGLAVYADEKGNGGGLTLNSFKNSNKGVGLFGGIIYSDGALNINSAGDNIGLGSFSKVYGSSINIDAGTGRVDAYGSIISTGNIITEENSGNITITGGNVNTYGEIKTAVADKITTIDGIQDTFGTDAYNEAIKNVNDETVKLPDVAEGYAHTTNKANSNGNISISATNGDVNIYYGNMEKGIIDTQGDVKLKGNNVYVDSDMVIGGNLNATAGSTGEIVLDISNIGKVTNNGNIVDEMHTFLDSFKKEDDGTGKSINFAGTDNAKITIDMWDYNNNNAFDLDKYDLDSSNTLSSKLDALNVTGINDKKGKDFVYIWVADGEQLKGIQDYADKNQTSNILSYNFALKNDINARDITGYQSIGGNGTAFTGNFDGRGNSIINLNVNNTNDSNSIFGTIGKLNPTNEVSNGKVSNLKVYSSNFQDGAIANENNGTIDNVTGLGNTITGTDSVGGLVGINNGTIQNSSDRSTVISQDNANAGGLVGTNTDNGIIKNSTTESAVTSYGKPGASMGGIAGTNNGNITNVDSLGVTSGLYIETDGTIASTSDNVGGIVGINNGAINSAYNESIVTGQDYVGGIAGTNTNIIKDVSNASSVTGDAKSGEKEKSEYVGGLVGSNTGSITNGRNNGTITGQDYVGGMVGNNGKNSSLSNLVNDDAANITGENNVGGIAGLNEGTISAKATNLTNRGQLTGQNNVGGIAGVNSGTIDYVKNDIILNVKDDTKSAEYFGGVAGINNGTINNATNRGTVNASEADFVGGIVGQNNGTLSGMGNSNEGKVTGKDHVGGVAGKNNKELNKVGVKNEGTVTAVDGGAGGIFGENTKDITNSDLNNSGAVEGNKNNSGTGGIIGINSGDISTTSLRNELNGKVSGVYNVGGLIGINSGTITGGKGEGAHGLDYYKYQIYNNGTIKAEKGSNIGGLIGENTGKLTAGYNTGKIVADDSTNVGGIVGNNNKGTVDKVFNTIINNGSVTGGDNVGGLIGNNNGKLTNGYSTSAVNGSSNVGNAVGTNSGTIDAIYSTSTSGKLINSNSGDVQYAYTYSNTDDSAKYLSEGQRKSLDFYIGFDKRIWKDYEGKATPLLKEFLTETKYENGQLVAADDWKAFNNTNGNGLNSLFNVSNVLGTLKYWSYQINTGSGTNSPNNLGYDLPEELAGPTVDYNWSHLYKDAPWDRNRDFKERKAEFNFVNGGIYMSSDETVDSAEN